MADISHHQFITLLKKSNVIDAKKLQPWLKQTAKIENARKLAKSLVQQELLTTWQAKFLLSGRHRLRIGNYFLLSRLRRDELGARYLAIHASLKRKVELQIFARDLTSDAKSWKDMIKKASLVAKLDHPALVHVYDIDHDDDRYFLVVEYVSGRSLDVQTEIFTTPQIGKLILQCADGIEFAHQNDVVHGTISQADILLTEKGTVKLQNLTVSPMRNQKNDEPEAKPIADFKALAKLGKKLLDANPGSDGDLRADLIKIFASMNAKGAGAMDQLRQWVEATSDAGENDRLTKSGVSPIFSTPGSDSKVDLSGHSKVTYEPDAPDEEEAVTSSASIVAAAKASPPFLIACALGLVMFLGIVGYGISRAYSKMVTQPAAAAEAKLDKARKAEAAKYKEREQRDVEAWEAKQKKKTEGAKQSNRPGKAKKKRRKGNKRPKGNDKAPTKLDENNVDPVETKPTDADPKPSETDSGKSKPDDSVIDVAASEAPTPKSDPPEAEEESNKFLDIFGDKKKAGPKEDGKGEAIPAVAADVVPDKLQKLTNIGEKTEEALIAGGIKTYEQISQMEPDALDQVLDSVGSNKIGEKKWQKAIAEAKIFVEEAAELAKEHFRKVPNAFQLPPIESTGPKALTKLEIPGNYFLSTELISPEGVSQRRVFFELKEDSSEEEKWIVSSKKKKVRSSVEIATFQKIGNKFIFAWRPEAANEKSAVYLKNCLVRLSTPDGRSRVSKLRRPDKSIRSLRISKESLVDQVSIDIDGLPHPDKIQIRLGALNNKDRTIEVIRPLATFDAPAIVRLKRREKGGFMNMQVSAQRSGKSIKLTAALVLRGIPIKSHKDLLDLQRRLEGFNTAAQQLADRAKRNSPEQRQAKVVKADFERMVDYKKSIDWLLEGNGGAGQSINFEVSADFEDGLVVLVQSNKNKPKPSKKKKK